MYFARLSRQKHLAWLNADIHALDAAETKITAGAMQHDCASGVDHVCLEEHFVNVAVIVDNVEFGRGQVEAPVTEVLVHDVDGVVFECRVETRALKDFAEDADGVDEVGEGAEDGECGEEGRVVVVLKSAGVGNVLC